MNVNRGNDGGGPKPDRNRNESYDYEKYNTQHKMPDGFTPLPQFNRSSWVTGVTYKPNADVAIKFDYVFNRNGAPGLKQEWWLHIASGIWFIAERDTLEDRVLRTYLHGDGPQA